MTDNVQLRDLVRFVGRVWWIPVVLAVLGATLGIAASRNVPPVYRSEATVLVGPTDGSITQTSTIRASEDLAAFYADMARRQVVLEPVTERLDLPQTWAELRNQVSAVVPSENLRIVTVTVTAMSQARATDIANELVNGLVSLSSEDPSENAQAFINEQADALKTMIDERKADIDSLEAEARATDDPVLKSELRSEANQKKDRLIDWQRVYVELASAEPTADAGGLQVIDEAAPVTDKGRVGTPRQAVLGGVVGAAVGVLISWIMYRRLVAMDAPAIGVVRAEQESLLRVDETDDNRAAEAQEDRSAVTDEQDVDDRAEEGSAERTEKENGPPEPASTETPPGRAITTTTPKNGNEARETPLSSRQGYGRVSNGRVSRTLTSTGSPAPSHPRDSRPTSARNGDDARETHLSSRQGYGRVGNGRVAGTRTAAGSDGLHRDMGDE
ncbi:MAG TPA: hypothetical protein VLB29_19740 [Nocardioidaceae bacterium]|nr:hypothetical protein [Nocardioidaceae bacterium]